MKHWICYVENTDGGRRYQHYTQEDAEREAERLARLPDVQGKQVYVYECVGTCQLTQQPVRWIR